MVPKKILVFGGTHGNEWTGVYIVNKFAEQLKKEFPELDLTFILSNPEAVRINRRFKDEDLNRAFQFLGENREGSYEHLRAREIRKIINEEDCFVIDLHTTTSNMGKTVILTNYNPLNLHLASRLLEEFSDCRVIGSPDPSKKYLGSQTDKGLMIEVGPVANSLLNAEVLEGTLSLLRTVFKNFQELPSKMTGAIEIYEETENIYYPKDSSGEINGHIHRDFQGKDFHMLQSSYTPFQTFQGDVIKHTLQEKLYPIFINEAAYYPEQLAFTLCRKRMLTY